MATNAGDLLGQLLGAALNSGSVRGASTGNTASGLPGGLGEVLGQMLGGSTGGAAGGGQMGGAGGLGDILGQVLGGAGGSMAGGQGGAAGGLGDILGQVLGGATGGSAGGQAGPAGGLGDILGQVLGGATGGSTAGGQGGGAGNLGGLGGLLGGLLGGAAAGGAAGGLGGSLGKMAQDALGGSASAPVPVPTPQGTPSTDAGESGGMGDLVKYGGMAVIGMMAFNAFRKWQSQSAAPSANLVQDAQGFSPAQAPGGPEAFSMVLLKAMAAAAQSDGKLDQDELTRITGGMTKMGADAPSQQALILALSTPVDPQELVNAATSPEAALQIYAASVLAINPDSPAELTYLNKLAQALAIDPTLKAQIDKDLTAA